MEKDMLEMGNTDDMDKVDMMTDEDEGMRYKEVPADGKTRTARLEATGKKGKMVRQKPYVVTIVILALLAVAGVGFGVAGMFMGMQKDAAKPEDEVVIEEEAVIEDVAGEPAQEQIFTAKNLLMRGNKVINWNDGTSRLVGISAGSDFGNGALSVYLSQQMAGPVPNCDTGADEMRESDEFSLIVSVDWDTVKDWYGLEGTLRKTGDENIEITNIDAARVVDVLATGFGNGIGDETILFLMDDGTLEYIPVMKAVKEGFRSYGKVKGVENVVLMRGSVGLHSGCSGGLDAIAQKANGDIYDLYRALSAQGVWD